MEKYCKSCGRVFKDSDFKICPYCGNQLSTRTGRQPIPRKLRHQVFQRDGYRCRECGASKDETSLEIDHIVPVAKGGTNDIDNLQTLCRECNRMKHTDEWVGGETDLKTAENELRNLEEQLQYAEERLNDALTEDKRIDYKFKIMKLNEKIPDVKYKIDVLEQQKLKKTLHKKVKQKETKRKNKLFKKLYVELDNNTLELLSEHYQIDYKNKDQLIRDLVNNYHEQEIFEVLLNYDVNLKNNKTIVRADEGKERFLAEKQGLKKCPNCGEIILKNAIRCKYCKSILKTHYESETGKYGPKYCPHCNHTISPSATRCPFCKKKI